METILTILFLVAAAIIHSFMKKKQDKEAETWLDDMRPGERDPHRPPRPGMPRPAVPRPARPQATNWEEELRRFLEGDKPAAPPPPPPVVYREPTPPPPLVRPSPTVMRVPAPAPPPLVFQPPPPQTVSYESDEGSGLPVHMPSLTESAQAYQRASQLESKVEEHMRQVTQHVSLHTKQPVQRTPAVRLNEALALLKTPQALRTAIVASVVLGPPKAMEV